MEEILLLIFPKKGVPMKTKTWLLIFALLLVLCGALSIFVLAPGDDARYAGITVNGKSYKTVDLAVPQAFTISQEEGRFNTITVRDGKIAVTEASCPDHYCMQRGYCSSGTQIVCLPNRVVISFLGDQEIDAAVG